MDRVRVALLNNIRQLDAWFHWRYHYLHWSRYLRNVYGLLSSLETTRFTPPISRLCSPHIWFNSFTLHVIKLPMYRTMPKPHHQVHQTSVTGIYDKDHNKMSISQVTVYVKRPQMASFWCSIYCKHWSALCCAFCGPFLQLLVPGI